MAILVTIWSSGLKFQRVSSIQEYEENKPSYRGYQPYQDNYVRLNLNPKVHNGSLRRINGSELITIDGTQQLLARIYYGSAPKWSTSRSNDRNV